MQQPQGYEVKGKENLVCRLKKRLYGLKRVTFILQITQPSIQNTMHIQLRYHFIRSVLEDGHLKLEKIHTSQNPADMLTKGVTREKLSSCSVSVGLQE
jgi:hypothetical protein